MDAALLYISQMLTALEKLKRELTQTSAGISILSASNQYLAGLVTTEELCSFVTMQAAKVLENPLQVGDLDLITGLRYTKDEDGATPEFNTQDYD
jgi:hypothetical protein